MRVLVDITHPAHVHLFKNAIWKLKEDRHEIQITARNKEITIHLLEAYDFDYVNIGDHKKTMVGKAFGILQRDYALYKVAKKFKPNVLVGGVGNLYVAQVSRLLGKPSIIFDDTEHAYLEHLLCDPFATAICTPSCFKKDLGPKQIRYNGYHEFAYLHPNYFTPDPSVLDELGLKEGERFIIMRFVAWNASHDVGHKGISMDMRRRFVSELEKYGRVLITSESELPAEFEPYRVKVAPEKMHDLLYYAALYVGEGGTMASEAAVLGTPAVYTNTLRMGYTDEEEYKYGLIFNLSSNEESYEDIIKKTVELVAQDDLKMEWEKKKDHLLNDKIDVTKFMIETIERYGGVVSE